MNIFKRRKLQTQVEVLNELHKLDKARIKELTQLCDTKDSLFKEVISDGLRHGSSLASRHMRERKDYLNR